MPAKVMILAQFDHGYYICGTLKRLMGVLAWLKAGWIRVSVKLVTDQKSMPPLHWRRGNAHKVMILAQFGYGYYIRGTLKRLMGALAWLKAWWIRTKNPCHCGLAREEMPAKVKILAQFDHGYYICGTLKRLTDVVAWLKAWWIHTQNPWSHCPGGEEMPTKVMMLAQFDHRYYIHGTLKRLTDDVAWLKAWWIRFDHRYYIRETLKRLLGVLAWLKAWWIRLMGVLAWLKAWWIRVSVKQVTDQKSMPLLPRWGGRVVILAQFGHRYYIHETLK
ncbi:hypothetical protein C8R44DRAFT_931416 [Mycena epipterygia]|nr:hypothetical protein C8R44DRAFT_931416 [Mycena epipterygia]